MKKVREIRSHVASDFLLWREPLSRHPQWGEANPSSNKTFPMEIQQNHQPTSPLPIWEGRGDRSNRRADYYDYRDEVKRTR